jgi:predicted nucleic acid-binding protein
MISNKGLLDKREGSAGSSVLLSGLFSSSGAPRLILDVLSLDLPVLKAVTGAYNVEEVERNLRIKLPAALPIFRSAMKQLGLEVVSLPLKEALVPLAGLTAAKDLPVIASANKGKAEIHVTGDKRDLLKLKRRRFDFSIASPAEFLDEVLPRLLKDLAPSGD